MQRGCCWLPAVLAPTAVGGVELAQVAVILSAAAAGEATFLAHEELGAALAIGIVLLNAVDLLQVGLQGAALGEGLVTDAAAVRADACRGDEAGVLNLRELIKVSKWTSLSTWRSKLGHCPEKACWWVLKWCLMPSSHYVTAS